MNERIKKLFWFSLLFKLIVGALIPLAADETYYWTWSHHLQLSYFDHPPFVAWLFALGQPFEGLLHAVRWPAILMGQATLFVWLQILKPYFSERQLFMWLCLALASPLMGLGGLIVTPDLPLMFFWGLATFIFIRAYNSPTWLNYFLLGSVLGISFCAKYHTALYLPMALGFLYLQKAYTKKLIPKIILGFLMFLVFSFPVIYWNWVNDFISFNFQWKHGMQATSWDPQWTVKYVFEQALIFFPIFLWFSYKKKSALPKPVKTMFMIFGWAPLAFFFYSSFKSYVEANWTIIGFPFILALGVAHTEKQLSNRLALGFWGILTAASLSLLLVPQLRELNPNIKIHQLDEISRLTDKITPIVGDSDLFASTYQNSSQLNYWLKKPVYKLRGMNRFDFYDMRDESIPKGKTYFVLMGKQETLPSWLKGKHQIIERNLLTDKYSLNKVDVIE